MQDDPCLPASVAYDVGQGEGTVFIPYARARRRFLGFEGFRDRQLHLVCSFCKTPFSVPHSAGDKQPFSTRITPEGEPVSRFVKRQYPQLARRAP
ncbi:MAG TPA: hypothetical protein VK689_03355 [Armatimonadota bacterium]|nr:hypothetical protein [Armatimonadota bacterium]